MKLWVLTNTPSPYQVELLAAMEAAGSCKLSVRFLRLEHRGQAWNPATPPFEYRGLRGWGPRLWSDAFRFHPSACREVWKTDHDLYVLSGQYTSLTVIACAVLLCWRRKPWALWLERPWPEDYRPDWSPNLSARFRGIGALRRYLLRSFLRRATRVFCIGSAARDAYRALGVSEDRLSVVSYCCDTRRYADPDREATQQLRRRFRLEGKTTFLFSGQLIPRKGVDLLLRAFARTAAERQDVALLILGDGPLRESLEKSVPEEIRDRVHFVGQVPQADLPRYFAAASVFVFPSRYDGWGVVINEACAAGLPVLSTDAVGAALDLVQDGVNGFILARDDEQGFYEKMKFFAGQPDRITAFGTRSRELAQKGSLEHGAALFCAAVEQTLAAMQRPTTKNEEPRTKNLS
ncbi:MAG: glycosyltransferase [Verrucomicrobia bacterium]|nr:glycosyltransferase [Verrucomicrobiota bacterium]MBU1910312.1 glycosyltransferase [Verrucomicrobiota bacterium]